MKTGYKNKVTFAISLIFAIFTLGSASAKDLSKGTWTKKANSAAGSWSIVEENGKRLLKISDLKTRKGPNLKIFLSPRSVSSVKGSNATSGSIEISALRSHKGSQTYELPASIDLSDYKSVLIHCEEYSKLWAAGSL